VDHNYGFTLGLRYALTSSIDTYANYSYFTRTSQPSTNNLDDHVMFVGIRKQF
jgi:predicted porin